MRLIDADELMRRVRVAMNGAVKPENEICYQWLDATVEQLAENPACMAEVEHLQAKSAKLELMLGDVKEELEQERKEKAWLIGIMQTVEVIFGRDFTDVR